MLNENIFFFSNFVCLFDLILYVPVNNFQLCQDRSYMYLFEPVLSKDKCVLLNNTKQWRRQPKHMRLFFWVPKTYVKTNWYEKIHNIILIFLLCRSLQNILTCMFSPAHHGSSCACQADVLSGNFLRNPLQYRPHSVASRVTSGESSSYIWWKNAFHMCCTENKMSEYLRFWYLSHCKEWRFRCACVHVLSQHSISVLHQASR